MRQTGFSGARNAQDLEETYPMTNANFNADDFDLMEQTDTYLASLDLEMVWEYADAHDDLANWLKADLD
jgi:hypothetical protein